MTIYTAIFLLLWTIYKLKLAATCLSLGISGHDEKLNRLVRGFEKLKSNIQSRETFGDNTFIVLTIITGLCLCIVDIIGGMLILNYTTLANSLKFIIEFSVAISIIRIVLATHATHKLIHKLGIGFDCNPGELFEIENKYVSIGFLVNFILSLSGIFCIGVNFM